jgi:hypothetical protein
VPPLHLQRIQGPVTLDGIGREPEWQQIEPLPLTMYTPAYRGELTERTEIRIAYDDNFLYVLGKMFDSSPHEVQANSLVRDLDRGGDFLNIMIDSYNDNQTMAVFMTTPAGNRLDAETINDAEGENFWNMGWNTYWDCAVVQNDEGWSAEMRIPFSSLRFQDSEGKATFGLIVHRLINRKNERQIYPAIAPKKPFSAWKASQAQKVTLEGISRPSPIYVTPYALGGNERFLNVNPLNTGYWFDDKPSRELGLDLKYGISNSLTLDVTLNTDFAQIESDDQQINLTRYSLYFPERRQFFQERSGVFEVNYGGSNKLFDSRKIGLTPTGLPVRILGGARIVGRLGAWDFGALNMQTDQSIELPSENFGVLRLRRPVINDDSYVGSLLTSRVGSDGSQNIVTGIDTKVRLQNADYLTVQATHAARTNSASSWFFENSIIDVEFDRRTTEGLGGNVTALYVGEQFDPGIGFNLWQGVIMTGPLLYYGWFDETSESVRKHTIDAIARVWTRIGDRSIQSAVWGMGWLVDYKSGTSNYYDYFSNYEDLVDTLLLAGKIRVPPGSYAFYTFRFLYTMSPGNLLRSDFRVGGGTFYDGHRFFIALTPTWNVSRSIEFGAEYEFNGLRFGARGESLDAHIVRLRARGSSNANFSTTLLAQYNSATKSLGSNLRLRYNFREGTDLFLVFNQLVSTNRQRYGFDVPATENSTLLLKYVHTFAF